MRILIIVALCSISTGVAAQTFMTRNANISFFSKTPLEDIVAENKQVYAAIDLSKKTIAFTLLLKSFLFEKQLMQDHFNENYVESDKYPRASFNGTLEGNLPTTAGSYAVQAKGQLTLHGVTRQVTIPATIELAPPLLKGTAVFFIKPGDYEIQIPAIVKDKIAREITVKVNTVCQAAQ